nr:Arm DNA-binding domain-containing protein [Variovorax guangxiensis]
MLTDKHCKNAACPPDKKRARFTDSSGLYLEVSPAGSKRWFWKTYANGKEGRMALGSYPTMSLAEARKARDTAKVQKADGIDPIQARKVQKLKATNPAATPSAWLPWSGTGSRRISGAPAMRSARCASSSVTCSLGWAGVDWPRLSLWGF